VISENASSTEPASLLAVFVLDSKEKVLTTPDKLVPALTELAGPLGLQ